LDPWSCLAYFFLAIQAFAVRKPNSEAALNKLIQSKVANVKKTLKEMQAEI